MWGPKPAPRRLFLALRLQQKGFLWSPLSRALPVRRYSSSTGQTSLLLSQCQIGICTSPRHLLRLPQSNHSSLAYFVCHPTSWDSRFCSLKALAPSLQPALPHLPLHLASGTCEQLPRSGYGFLGFRNTPDYHLYSTLGCFHSTVMRLLAYSRVLLSLHPLQPPSGSRFVSSRTKLWSRDHSVSCA